jgi:6,7-dimethyl-8-ribityllumazine synthase
MQDPTTIQLDASGLRIGVARSRYHSEMTDRLCAGAEAAFVEAGGDPDALVVVPAPGTFELTAVCRALATRDDIDAVVALGCVIRGETAHDRYICEAVAAGLTSITADTGKPVAFGVLTCQTRRQASERAGGALGNKGTEAMRAAIEMVAVLRSIAEAGSASRP